ncbi:MAG: hypothetical protein A2271_03970 [Candidatus Moranbacteria bacterium RIFOXYA12_FULL_35_19]|nr:MAG: hypothetical protein A2343_04220 [Candidatus Moranbacteria bacterium RIFOXYB12_FULL_35_8]OGI33297.1 MAG: hypothetical protein A2489_01175 [Candidatus Moranbacteria bacterium RIFOXYC12_FULL_36_13]OGI36815.1 MAG: hypothetical protein A2271_03970 [Candidatus Moranbacteria bacterium RIFOXYA12_FULL_35_19]
MIFWIITLNRELKKVKNEFKQKAEKMTEELNEKKEKVVKFFIGVISDKLKSALHDYPDYLIQFGELKAGGGGSLTLLNGINLFCKRIYLTEDKLIVRMSEICEKIEERLHLGAFEDDFFVSQETLRDFLESKEIFERRLSDLNCCEEEIQAWKEEPD